MNCVMRESEYDPHMKFSGYFVSVNRNETPQITAAIWISAKCLFYEMYFLIGYVDR